MTEFTEPTEETRKIPPVTPTKLACPELIEVKNLSYICVYPCSSVVNQVLINS